MVIGLKRAGWSIRQIAADTHLGASTVHRLWRRWLEQGNMAIYRNVGATRVTSARVDRRILRQAVAAPQATCTAILQNVQDTLDHSISTRTISRRLVANGLHSCRPLRRLPLTPPNRRQRLEWCRARSTWMTEWHRVVFSDESRFCLSSDSRRVRVWRRRGERSNPAAIVERPTVRQRGIMVWGAIAYDSRSPLLRIQGTMTAQRYVDDVLRPDNARPHTARISQQALQDVQMLPWPPYSPDLSPIEHVWDIIGRLCMPYHSRDAIRTLIDPLPRRVAACIAVRGLALVQFSRTARTLPMTHTQSEDPRVSRLVRLTPANQGPKPAYSFTNSGQWHSDVRQTRRVDSPLHSPLERARLNWCLEHHAWTHDQWANVPFSDESRFSLNTDYRRVFIWREPGTRYHPSNIREIDSFRGGSLLVWAGISSSRRTHLHIFSGGTLTAQRYRDEILEPYLRPYRDQIGHNIIFMDDNARPHRARLVNEYLQSENIRRMDWPARSPDLNPIERVWDALGRRIGARHPSLRTLVELRTALLEEWGLLPLDLLLQSMVNSMRARCETLIAVRADSVKLNSTGGKAFLKKALNAINAVWAISTETRINSIRSSLKLLDSMTLSTLLYAAPIWANNQKNLIDRVQDNFLRRLLNLPRYTPGFILRMECGRTSLGVTVLKLTLGFWLRILKMNSS
ncbi:hypothetical protein LAZ67_X001011 [Cordylochernes scorpioides]|uniref:Transposable element Tcb2 transposase n=1 Tax=Cordylochernes scorpioides TaxID=51811 RepID=A0ABY6LW62_9ARAC|nr:hypothetical protein LAZ67_X001011 [Cordylochernes scorpioides]